MQRVDSLAVVDVETTGLGNRDRIIEIAVILLDPLSLETTDEFDTLVNPLRDVGPTRIHGISASMVSAAPLFEEISGHLATLLHKSILIAHNLPFDARFLSNEFARTPVQGDLGHGVCTLRATKQKLSVACDSLGVQHQGAHRALDDARATAEIFRKLRASGMPIEGESASLEGPSPINFTRTLRREHVGGAERKTAIPPLRWALPADGDAELSYLNMLDRYLDDGILSDAERGALHELANLYGIADHVLELHTAYVQAIRQAAWRDGILTHEEASHLEQTAGMLGVILPEFQPPTSAPEIYLEKTLDQGLRVCFTGEAEVEGRSWQRSELHALAVRNGLVPVDTVTKKSCDLLVAADISTASGKAKKARDWGIHVMSVDEFVRGLT